MKKNIKLKMLSMVLFISFVNVFGQNSNNKIFFLNDIYSAYAETAENQVSDLNNVYKDKIQSIIINRYFLKVNILIL